MIFVERRVTADTTTTWGVISRLDDWHRLLPTVDDVTRVGPVGPVAIGSRFRLRQPGLPPAVYVVTEWEPEKGFTWESAAPGVRAIATHTLRSEGGATTLRLGIEWTGPGTPLMRLLLTGKARRYLSQEAATFARLAEEAAR